MNHLQPRGSAASAASLARKRSRSRVESRPGRVDNVTDTHTHTPTMHQKCACVSVFFLNWITPPPLRVLMGQFSWKKENDSEHVTCYQFSSPKPLPSPGNPKKNAHNMRPGTRIPWGLGSQIPIPDATNGTAICARGVGHLWQSHGASGRCLQQRKNGQHVEGWHRGLAHVASILDLKQRQRTTCDHADTKSKAHTHTPH